MLRKWTIFLAKMCKLSWSRPHGRLLLCSRIKCVSYSPDSLDILPVSISPEFLPDTVNHTLDFSIYTKQNVILDCFVDLFSCK